MENQEIKKEDALYFLNGLLDAESTKMVCGLACGDSVILKSENSHFSILLTDYNFSIILEEKIETYMPIYRVLCQFELSSDELFSIDGKIELLKEKGKERMIEIFRQELEEMKKSCTE